MTKKEFFKSKGISEELTIKVTTPAKKKGGKPQVSYVKLGELCDDYVKQVAATKKK